MFSHAFVVGHVSLCDACVYRVCVCACVCVCVCVGVCGYGVRVCNGCTRKDRTFREDESLISDYCRPFSCVVVGWRGQAKHLRCRRVGEKHASAVIQVQCTNCLTGTRPVLTEPRQRLAPQEGHCAKVAYHQPRTTGESRKMTLSFGHTSLSSRSPERATPTKCRSCRNVGI